MRERVGIAAAVLVVMFSAHPAAASLRGTIEVDDVADGIGSSTVESLDSALGGVEEAVKDTAGGATEVVKDTAGGVEEAVKDTAGGVEEAVKDTAGGATEAVKDTAGGATEAVKGTALDATHVADDPVAPAPVADDPVAPAPVAGGAAGGSGTGEAPPPAGSEPADGPADTGTAPSGVATGGHAAQQPDGQGTFLQLHDVLGWTAPASTQYTLAGRPDHASARAGTAAEPRDTLVATVRVGEREPFVADASFGTPADTITVRLEPTGGSPLAGPDDHGAATEPFPALVMIGGEDPFRADVRVVVRPDGLVLLVEPTTPAVAAVTEVLARVVERLASTGLPLLALVGLGVGLLTTGGLAVRAYRSRPRWSTARSS